MDIVCIDVIFVKQHYSIQLADPEIFKLPTVRNYPHLSYYNFVTVAMGKWTEEYTV